MFSKKKRNAINIISFISALGVTVGTAALVIVLSVFNGFEDLLHSLYNAFDPDIKITPATGKTFIPYPDTLEMIQSMEGVVHYAEVLEETALLKNDDQQHIATIKGVSAGYAEITGIDSMIIEGSFLLQAPQKNYAVIGQGVAYYLGTGTEAVRPISVYVPKRTGRPSMNPARAFNRKLVFASGIFAIEQEFDTEYVLLPLDFVRDILEYNDRSVTSLEVKTTAEADPYEVKETLQELLGDRYTVKTRYELNELFYRVMQSEKWAIFMILTFILIIASFNIVGSLTMLIIEKKEDILTLANLGADKKLLSRIFISEGWLITVIGTLIGGTIGIAICYLQINFELVKFAASGSFIIDAYPVSIKWMDILIIILTVWGIGLLASWFPVRKIRAMVP